MILNLDEELVLAWIRIINEVESNGDLKAAYAGSLQSRLRDQLNEGALSPPVDLSGSVSRYRLGKCDARMRFFAVRY